MKIAYASDLHMEVAPIGPIKSDADILVLAGDIFNAEHFNKMDGPNLNKALTYRKFLRQTSEQFEHVILIAGNHEFYDGRYLRSISTLSEVCSGFSNVHFLNDSTFIYKDITFIGSTLWTDFDRCDYFKVSEANQKMSDYHAITFDDIAFRKLRPQDTYRFHQKSLQFITDTVKNKFDTNFVVVSHHAPTYASIADIYRGQSVNSCYASDLSEFILDNPQIKLWIHGHTHTDSDYMVGSTRVVCNPRGYFGYEEVAEHFDIRVLSLVD